MLIQENSRKNSTELEHFFQNGKCSNLQETIEINSINFSYSDMKEQMLCFYSGETLIDEDEKLVLLGSITKRLGKKVDIIYYNKSFSILQYYKQNAIQKYYKFNVFNF